jgi:hypothetical protein
VLQSDGKKDLLAPAKISSEEVTVDDSELFIDFPQI